MLVSRYTRIIHSRQCTLTRLQYFPCVTDILIHASALVSECEVVVLCWAGRRWRRVGVNHLVLLRAVLVITQTLVRSTDAAVGLQLATLHAAAAVRQIILLVDAFLHTQHTSRRNTLKLLTAYSHAWHATKAYNSCTTITISTAAEIWKKLHSRFGYVKWN